MQFCRFQNNLHQLWETITNGFCLQIGHFFGFSSTLLLKVMPLGQKSTLHISSARIFLFPNTLWIAILGVKIQTLFSKKI